MGWDEAFMAAEVEDPIAFARDVQRAVLDRTRLWCSIGVGDSKHRAKLASAFAKRRGVFRLTRDEWGEVMGSRPVDALWGIGAKTATKLGELGIHTVAELANTDDGVLAARFGPNIGPWLRQLGTGEDDGAVSAEPYVSTGRGRERTFQQDLTDLEEIRTETGRLAEELTTSLEADGEERLVARIVVKVRVRPFFTSTHGMKLPEPTREPEAIAAAALEALDRFHIDRPVRLLGVRVEFARDG
jgi:DNA polymerase-4